MPDIKLCVNIDHIATLRQSRGGVEPDPILGAQICEENGAQGITVHLREDRRHIQDEDVIKLKGIVKGKYNLELALSRDIINVAKKVVPDQVTIVPEKREELTTEGGLNVKDNFSNVKNAVKEFQDSGMIVSLFIEPDIHIIELSKETGADYIEIHTGAYCDAGDKSSMENELEKIYDSAEFAVKIGIGVNAGHGLNYDNTGRILNIAGLDELNIGHSIISKAVFYGLPQAVKKMVSIIEFNK